MFVFSPFWTKKNETSIASSFLWLLQSNKKQHKYPYSKPDSYTHHSRRRFNYKVIQALPILHSIHCKAQRESRVSMGTEWNETSPQNSSIQLISQNPFITSISTRRTRVERVIIRSSTLFANPSGIGLFAKVR